MMKIGLRRISKNPNFRLGLAVLLALTLVWISYDSKAATNFRSIWGDNLETAQDPGDTAAKTTSIQPQAGSTKQDTGSGQTPDTAKEAADSPKLAIEADEQKFNDLLVSGTRAASPEKFFAQYRLERDQTRGRQVEWVQSIVNNPKTSEATRQEAQKKLLSLSDNLSWEMQIENMLRAKNFQDAIVFLKEGSVTVIVQAPELGQQDITRITDLVCRVTGRNAQELVIIPKN